MAGNIGDSFAKQVSENDHKHYVLEVSSFQLDDINHFKPKIAVLTNITPDHLIATIINLKTISHQNSESLKIKLLRIILFMMQMIQ